MLMKNAFGQVACPVQINRNAWYMIDLAFIILHHIECRFQGPAWLWGAFGIGLEIDPPAWGPRWSGSPPQASKAGLQQLTALVLHMIFLFFQSKHLLFLSLFFLIWFHSSVRAVQALGNPKLFQSLVPMCWYVVDSALFQSFPVL